MGSNIRNLIKNTPLLSGDIQKKVACKFMLYEDINKITNIRELMPMTLILYQLARVGHFCCVFENGEGVNFFDPLGFEPDEQLEYASGYAPHHDFTYLIKLLRGSGKPIIYSNYTLQSMNTSTCGHWCTIRMLYRNLFCDEFAECFKGIKNRDAVVFRIFYSL